MNPSQPNDSHPSSSSRRGGGGPSTRRRPRRARFEHRGPHQRAPQPGSGTPTRRETRRVVRQTGERHRGERLERRGLARSKNIPVPPPTLESVRIIPLGGVEEIGRNMSVIEFRDDIIVIDAGVQFHDDDTPAALRFAQDFGGGEWLQLHHVDDSRSE